MDKEKKDKKDLNQKMNKSYQQMVYGKYLFAGKIALIVLVLGFLVYAIILSIANTFKVETRKLSWEHYMMLPEKTVDKPYGDFTPELDSIIALMKKDNLNVTGKNAYRDVIYRLLADRIVKIRTDTFFIVIDDSKYYIPKEAGEFENAQEKLIYHANVHAMELIVKRALFELNFPLIYTVLISKSDAEKKSTTDYIKKSGAFDYLMSKTIPESFTLWDSIIVKVPDTLTAYFDDLYSARIADQLHEKYVGTGSTGEYKYLNMAQFGELSEEDQKEQRRAFLKLDDKAIIKARMHRIPIYMGLSNIKEISGEHFETYFDRKIHEQEIQGALAGIFNHVTMSLMYPMANVVYKAYQGGSGSSPNSALFIALQAREAPAQYNISPIDCPKVLKMKMYADITKYIKDWDQLAKFPKGPMAATTYEGRYYGMPRKVLSAEIIAYRKDWLLEPLVYEWIKEKGWIHPVDSLPYIHYDWTWADFRELASLYTKSALSIDSTSKRKGYIDAPGNFAYLDAFSPFHGIIENCIKPNPTGESTWRFFGDNPLLKEALINVHDMYWHDRSLTTGVEVNYQNMNSAFMGGRAAMTKMSAHSILYAMLTRKYSAFEKPYDEVVGLASMPGSGLFRNAMNADCGMLGFSPLLDSNELELAVEWIKHLYYGEFVNNSLEFKVREARILGSEAVVYRDAMASPYAMDFSKFNIDVRGAFPPNYLDFYDSLRGSQSLPVGPSPDKFGLSIPMARALQDELNLSLFQKVIMDSLPNYDLAIKESEDAINALVLTDKDSNQTEKFIKYYDAKLKYYKEYLPGYYTIFKDNFDKYLKYW